MLASVSSRMSSEVVWDLADFAFFPDCRPDLPFIMDFREGFFDAVVLYFFFTEEDFAEGR